MSLRFLVPLVVLALVPPVLAQAGPLCWPAPGSFGLPPVLFDDFDYGAAWAPRDGDATTSASSVYGANWWRTTSRDSVRAKAWYRFNRYDLGSNPVEVHDGIARLVLPARDADRSRDAAISSSFVSRYGTYAARLWMTPAEEGERVIQAFWFVSPARYLFETADGRTIAWSAEIDAEFTTHFHGDRGPLLDVSAKRSRIESERFDQLEGIFSCVTRNGERADGCQRADGTSMLEGRWITLIVEITPGGVSFSASAEATTRDPEMWAGGGGWGQPLSLDGAGYAPARPVASILSLHDRNRGADLPHEYEMLADWYLYSPCASLQHDDVHEAVRVLRARGLPRVNTTLLPTEVREPSPREPHTALISGPSRVRYGHSASWRADTSVRGSVFYATFRYRWLDEEGRPGGWIDSDRPVITLQPEPPSRGVEFEATFRDHYFPHGPNDPNNHTAVARRTVTFNAP